MWRVWGSRPECLFILFDRNIDESVVHRLRQWYWCSIDQLVIKFYSNIYAVLRPMHFKSWVASWAHKILGFVNSNNWKHLPIPIKIIPSVILNFCRFFYYLFDSLNTKLSDWKWSNFLITWLRWIIAFLILGYPVKWTHATLKAILLSDWENQTIKYQLNHCFL